MDSVAQKQLNTWGLNKPQLLSLIAAFVICAGGLWWGIRSGISRQRSKVMVKNASALAEALKYYKADQGVYPTQEQFSNKNILVPFYLNAAPTDISEGDCKNFKGFQYKLVSSQKFSLQYCLEVGVDGRKAGINEITEKDLK